MKDVLIVGAGPTGMVLACELAKYGLSVDIIEKKAGNLRQSKALSVSSATLKAFHGLGVVGEVLQKGNRLHDIFIHFNQHRIAHIDMSTIRSPYNCYLTIPQPDTEAILEKHLNKLDVSVIYQAELLDFEQDEGSVSASLQVDGAKLNRQYRYVVGCDGARSQVRKTLNCAFEGYDYGMYFIMADVKFEDNKTYDTAHYYIDDKGFLIFLPMKNGLTRIVVKKSGVYPDSPVVPTRGEMQGYLNQYVPFKPVISEMVWRSSAPFYNRLTGTNKFGRVFLAGDSYHLFSPIGGQGMNTGIQDALNLGWKLAFVLKKLSPASILDSYPLERLHAVKAMLEATHVNTQLISRKWLGDEGKFTGIERYIPSFKNRRYYRKEMAEEFSGLLSTFKDSCTLAGKQVPYVQFKQFSTFDIPKANKLVLLVRKGCCSEALKDALIAFNLQVRLCEVDLPENDALNLAFQYCLVRPDGYVALQADYDDFKSLSRYLKENLVIHALETGVCSNEFKV